METYLTHSRIRQRLLGLLFSDPGKSYYLSEMARFAGTSAGNVQRELARFVQDHLVLRVKRGKLSFYSVNPGHDLFPELQPLVRKTCGMEGVLRAYFRTRPEVQAAYLFGSQATGRSNQLSDVDVAVLIDPSQIRTSLPYGYKAEICADLMKLLRTNSVDLVLLNEAPVFLLHQILKSGRCLFAKDRHARIRFEAKAIGRYLDVRPLLQSHDELGKAA
ncbi:MAG: nucleotidyltransferase domain-containing protein [Candidatus Omnitrophica bacterium]|nr:nucleotidyltransferase domain-containing protein [Candidatus Omnitrophota bacterium]